MVDGIEGTTGSTQGTETQTTAAPAPATQETTPSTASSASAGKPVLVEGQQAQPAAYTPNFKYNILGKEQEFDAFLRGVIKDSETEEKIRSLYTKAYGLDHMKGQYLKTRDILQTKDKEMSSITSQLQEVSGYLGKKDFGNFFKSFNVKPDDVLEWAVQFAERKQLPPEQQQMFEAREAAETQLRDVQRQNEWLQQQYNSQVANTRQMELNQSMADSQVSDFAMAYDQRTGQEGAFEMEVVRRGALHYQMTGQDLPPQEVVKQTLFALGWQGHSNQNQGSNVTQMPRQASGRPPIIPHIAGKSVSPVKKSPKSLDELRTLARSMA